MTIFDKILSGEINCKKVYEDKYTLAFHDIDPKAPVHILVIPKKRIVNIASSSEKDVHLLGHILNAARIVAEQEKIAKSGYRLIFNNNQDAGQSVDYLHCHVLGGRAMGWPPG